VRGEVVSLRLHLRPYQPKTLPSARRIETSPRGCRSDRFRQAPLLPDNHNCHPQQ
jgi:hypothetical protein